MTPQHTLEVYRKLLARPSQRYRWRLVVNGRKVANGGEGYTDRAECKEMALRIVQGHYGDVHVVER